MSISKVSNRWLNRAYKSIAIFLVIFAVLISALRLLLPYAHNYRTDLQDYINQTYNSNIIIGALNMGWQSSGPTLVASNVSLLQTDEAEIYVQAFDLNVDFWQSIKNRRLITKDFSLSGVKVLFDKTIVSETEVSNNNSALLSNLTELFFSQIGRFSVNNSQVIYRTKQGSRTLLIDSLHWLNQGNNHRAEGNVIVDGITSNNLRIKLDVQGEHVEDMQGTLYLAANQLNITPWLGKVLAIADENTHSTINFDAWLSIDQGQLDRLQLALGQNQIAWQYNGKINTLNIEQGQVMIDNLAQPDQLTVYSSPIDVTSNKHQWQPLTFSLQQNGQTQTSYISNVDIAGSAHLLPLLVKDEQTRSLIKKLAPTGELHDIFWQKKPNGMSLVASLAQVNTQYGDGIPGVENLSGELIYQPGKLHANIHAEQGALDFAQHFARPIQYQSLTSSLDFVEQTDGWQLSSDDFQFSSKQLTLSGELAVFKQPEKDIELSLLATATKANVVDAPSFYPHLLMGENLVNYLNAALVKGQLAQAVVMINGPLTAFPYGEGNGIFVVDAELTNASFKFDQGWPAIEHFNANLNFTNNSMLITGRDGTLSGIEVKGVEAAIEDLSEQQTLMVDATFDGTNPALIANLMMTSPFSDSVGAVLEQVVVSEKIAGDFHLLLPLNDTDSAIAKGNITFKDNVIDLQSPQMHFSQLNGSLSFENDQITTDGLSAVWRGMPMKFAVTAQAQENSYRTDILLSAHWQEQQWQQQLPPLLRSYGSGELNWQGQLVLSNRHDGKFTYQLNLDSELSQLQLNLPAPYQKTPEQQVTASVSVFGDKEQSTIDAQIGEQLNFYGNLEHQQVAFSQAHLILGDEPMYLPMSGFHITTNLAEADFFQWQPLIIDIIDSLEKSEPQLPAQRGLLAQPERIRGDIATLTFWDEAIHGVSFNLEDQLSWWLLELSSKEARAAVKFYPDWHTQGLDVNADFIRLSPDKLLFGPKQQQAKEQLTSVFDSHKNDELFRGLPPMRFDCLDCRYGNLNLGEVTFALERSKPELVTMKNFVAKRKGNKLSFDVLWHHDETSSESQIVGSLSSNDIERELERLAIPSTVKDSGLKSSFDLHWRGGPHDFAIAQLNGELTGKLDEGYLSEVPDQARAFSILSLQSLVRKLKFDFRDIFSDGMFYSEVKGDFQLRDGVIYTKNTFLKGNAGDLTVKGNTDLNSEELDYRMSYKPNVTSSLPAIAWIATLNPVTFLAGIAIDEVITSKVVSEYKFEVTGSIDKPNFREVDRKTQNISVGRDSPPQIVENLPSEKNDSLTTVDPEKDLGEKANKTKEKQDKIDG
ncbi:YhdP family protein [Thalassotalea sp. G2M2-11]|uniref:YhdP family protein n=1 Tax=Thalassotalea sp. G2M2-11 TaxID=2787627 RepID=UPI0019D030C9|nr:YhdP family protein [Thalassotalea sp. G2M2-11]